MGIMEMVVLGIVQGIAEFLPISSSAHLIIFRDIFGVGSGLSEDISLCLDVALHLGTLLAIGIYFFDDFMTMIIKGFTRGVRDWEGKMFWYLVVATIPAALAGVLLEDVIMEAIRTNYILIALALAFMGIVIYFVDRTNQTIHRLEKMNFWQVLVIGCSQVFALIPGFSRSGTTIAAGRMLQFHREDAAKFSFYLSAPVVLGAVVLNLLKESTRTIIFSNVTLLAFGVLVSFIAGLLCIAFLLKYLQKHDFKIFMWYRVILALIVLILVVF